jgi:hypothetical protein
MPPVVRVAHTQANKWTTLETHWNVPYTAYFQGPAEADVKIRYGGDSWWNGWDGSRIHLSDEKVRKISADSIGSLARARLQIRASRECDVRYAIQDGVPQDIPIHF